MDAQTKVLQEFARFRLDSEKRILWCENEVVNLPPKAVDLLCVLLEHKNQVLSKEDLIQRVWADSFVEESNLTHHIYALRKTFKEFGCGENLIQTVPRRGYRFVGEAAEVFEREEVVVERHVFARTLVEEFEEDEEIVREEEKGRRREEEKIVQLENLIAAPPRRRVSASLLVAACVLLAAVVAAAAGGFYLRSKNASAANSTSGASADEAGFTDDDKVVTDFGFAAQKAWAIAAQPDGKIVTGGWVGASQATSDFAVARYNPDGTLDETFDADGRVVTALTAQSDLIYGLAIQPDGKIVAVGVSFTGPKARQFCIVRYKPDGALDASFDGDGIVNLTVGTNQMDTAYAVAIQPDGKIVVAGSALMLVVAGEQRLQQNNFGLVRLNHDGSLDATFGDGGKLITDFGQGVDVAYALCLQPDGKIIAAGVGTNGMNQDFALARYNFDGSLDETFGLKGRVRTNFSNEDDLISAVAIQPDGKIVVAGYSVKATAWDFALARYAADGSLDNSFNGSGKTTVDLSGGGNDVARAVAVQPDGKIVAAGSADTRSAAPAVGFVRLSQNGKPDENFNDAGKLRVAAAHTEALGMILTPDNFAVAAGSAGDGKSSDFVLIRARL